MKQQKKKKNASKVSKRDQERAARKKAIEQADDLIEKYREEWDQTIRESAEADWPELQASTASWVVDVLRNCAEYELDHSNDPPWDHSGQPVLVSEQLDVEMQDPVESLFGKCTGGMWPSFCSGMGMFPHTLREDFEEEVLRPWISNLVDALIQGSTCLPEGIKVQEALLTYYDGYNPPAKPRNKKQLQQHMQFTVHERLEDGLCDIELDAAIKCSELKILDLVYRLGDQFYSVEANMLFGSGSVSVWIRWQPRVQK